MAIAQSPIHHTTIPNDRRRQARSNDNRHFLFIYFFIRVDACVSVRKSRAHVEMISFKKAIFSAQVIQLMFRSWVDEVALFHFFLFSAFHQSTTNRSRNLYQNFVVRCSESFYSEFSRVFVCVSEEKNQLISVPNIERSTLSHSIWIE